MMLAAAALTMSGLLANPPEPAPATLPGPLIIDVRPRACLAAGDADVTVCGRRNDNYRIDPAVLAGERAREASNTDNRLAQQRAFVADCTKEASKCQGSGVVPILPGALKAITAVILAVQGDDWREPFRTGPNAYKAYRAEQERRKSGIAAGVSASSGSPPPR